MKSATKLRRSIRYRSILTVWVATNRRIMLPVIPQNIRRAVDCTSGELESYGDAIHLSPSDFDAKERLGHKAERWVDESALEALGETRRGNKFEFHEIG